MTANKVKRLCIASKEHLKNFFYDLREYFSAPFECIHSQKKIYDLKRRWERIIENADILSKVKNYEIITEDNKRVFPLEESEGYYASYTRLRRKIGKILDGLPVIIDPELYVDLQRFHIDVYAETEDEALRILEENRDKVNEVYKLFGEIPGKFKVARERNLFEFSNTCLSQICKQLLHF